MNRKELGGRKSCAPKPSEAVRSEHHWDGPIPTRTGEGILLFPNEKAYRI